MNLKCQASALKELENLASRDRHSILIEGIAGSGKTYLAKQYAKFLDISDFSIVSATVNDIRKAIDESYIIESKVVLCVENIDNGVLGASYTLLKFLEEPRNNIYIVVTCCNMNKVPDTIISRSSIVTLSNPTESDLIQFSSNYPQERQKIIKNYPSVWKAVKNFHDVDYCMNLTVPHCDYLTELITIIKSKKPVSDIVWAVGHYSDQTEIPPEFAVKYIISNTADSIVKKYGIICTKELDSSRLASHAILSKFIFNCKYGD